MKIAITSSAFAEAFRRGALTHLEWLEGCASRLDAEGVVFDIADFPRADAEYAAQCKKITVDLGLVPLALDAPGLLDPERSDDERGTALDLAVATGALLLRTSAGAPGPIPPQTFVRTVALTKAFAKRAKSANVTLAVRPRTGTSIASIADLKHLAKDVDSAWLRYDVAIDEPGREALGPRERVLIERMPLGTHVADEALRRRGWYAIEGDAGTDPFAVIGALVAELRKRAMTTAGAVYVPG